MPPEQSSTEQDWAQAASDWIRWVRRPGLDSYWRYRDDFFALVPEPGTATLDLGCGEGRVSRDLAAAGHRITGIDVAPALIDAAREAHAAGRYLVADAARLPFAGSDFDLVIAYNFLMDVTDLDGSVGEAARVLRPGGRLVLSITHPVTNTGWPVNDQPGAPFVLDGSYFERTRLRHVEERDGLRVRFSSWVRPLSDYTGALERAGLLIEAVREPAPRRSDGFVATIPYHLWVRAVRPER